MVARLPLCLRQEKNPSVCSKARYSRPRARVTRHHPALIDAIKSPTCSCGIQYIHYSIMNFFTPSIFKKTTSRSPNRTPVSILDLYWAKRPKREQPPYAPSSAYRDGRQPVSIRDGVVLRSQGRTLVDNMAGTRGLELATFPNTSKADTEETFLPDDSSVPFCTSRLPVHDDCCYCHRL